MHLTEQDHWVLVLSGHPLGRFTCIKDAVHMVRTLHPNCELESTHITDQLYEVKVQTQKGNYFYTTLWSLE
jgi:hypothetical protein